MSSYANNYRNSECRKLEFLFSDFPEIGISKKIRPEYPELETEPEFCFRWGSQKWEPKIGIPNQDLLNLNFCVQSKWTGNFLDHT